MGRAALLIGVNHYRTGLHLSPLGQDVGELQRLLKQPHLQFDTVEDLSDRDLQETKEGIETFFRSRDPNDQVLFLLRGYGFQDVNGSLYFITSSTALDQDGNLRKATALPASTLQDFMNDSPAKQQVVILDAPIRKTFSDNLQLEESAIDLEKHLGGDRRRVILTAFTATHDVVEPDNLDAWSYTRYLTEGVETGAAAKNGNGTLTPAEWHSYAMQKLKVAAPATQADILGSSETAQIPLLSTPEPTRDLQYRQFLEQKMTEGVEVNETGTKFATGRDLLEALRQRLGLSPEAADEIENQVLRPVREYRRRLGVYRQQFDELTEGGNHYTSQAAQRLNRLRQALGLTDANVVPINSEIDIRDYQRQRSQYQDDLAWYEQQLIAASRRRYPLSDRDRRDFRLLQQFLHLKDEDVQAIEDRLGTQTETPTTVVGETIRDTRIEGLGNDPTVVQLLTELSPEQRSVLEQKLVTELQDPNLSPAGRQEREQLLTVLRSLPPTTTPDPKPGTPKIIPAVAADPREDKTTVLQEERLRKKEPVVEPIVVEERKPSRFGQALPWLIAAAILAALLAALFALLAPRNFNLLGFLRSTNRTPTNPGLAQQYNSRGMSIARQGNNKQAIEQYNRALELNPNDPATYINRGVAYHKLGDTDAALKDYNEAIQRDPESALAYSNRSNVYYDRGDYNQSLNDAKKAIELDPQLTQSYINLANSQLRTAQDPTNAQVQQEAIENYNRAITSQPVRPLLAAVALTNRGNVQLAQNRVSGALRDYNRAVQLNPDYAEAYYNRAISQQTVGNRQAAISDFSKAADLYKKQGLPKLAEDARNKVTELQQTTPPPPADS